jgi:hypothetical protein
MISFTGRGYLSFFMFIGLGVGCGALAVAVGARDTSFLITFTVLYSVIGTPLHWLVGTRLNTERTPDGPRRQDSNLFGVSVPLPMQYWAMWYPTCAAVVLAIGVAAGGSGGWAVVIGVAALIGLVLYIRWARRDFDKVHPPSSVEAEELFPDATPTGATSGTRQELAATRGWRYQRHAGKTIQARWYDRYGKAADAIAAANILAGELDGLPFTVFDTFLHEGPLADRAESRRTICLVHLPVSLPDVRLRPRLLNEDQFLPDPDESWAVADEPPWNCDLLPRARGLEMIAGGEVDPPMVAEADEPGLAEALVTDHVRRETLRHRLPGWRIHGRDLIFVGLPGPWRMVDYTAAQSMAVVAALAAVARSLPAAVVQHYGAPPTAGLPLADSEDQTRIDR